MFTITKFKDAYLAKYHSSLAYPYYVTEIPDFITTLDSLYQWKNHQVSMKNLVLPAFRKAMRDKQLGNFIMTHETPDDSPNVLFSPRKKRKIANSTKSNYQHSGATDIEGEDIEDLETELAYE